MSFLLMPAHTDSIDCGCRGNVRLPNGTLSPAAFSPIPRTAAAAVLQVPTGSALLLPAKEPQLHFEMLWEQDIPARKHCWTQLVDTCSRLSQMQQAVVQRHGVVLRPLCSLFRKKWIIAIPNV